jgi:hypothetical protein
MSLLGTPVYANPSVPLWASATGANFSGPVFGTTFSASDSFVVLDASGGTATRLTATGSTPGTSYIQAASAIKFGQINQGTTNTTLTISAPGANTDLLNVGGKVAAQQLTLATGGSAGVVGTGTLTGGQAVISTTASDVGAFIFITRTAINASTALGQLRVSNQGANNFTITSCQAGSPTTTETGDLSSFAWVIINPA